MGGPKQTLPESCQKIFFNQKIWEIEVTLKKFKLKNLSTQEQTKTPTKDLRDNYEHGISKRKGGRQGKLIDKERQEFLSDFERNPSEREKRKLKKKTNYKDSGRGRNKNNVYDEKGILISCGKDVCDCMDDSCPGCHFPCPKCRSNKCGNECRQNRKWLFESVELDGN